MSSTIKKKSIAESFPKTVTKTYGDLQFIQQLLMMLMKPISGKKDENEPQMDLLGKYSDLFLFKNKSIFENFEKDYDLIRAQTCIKDDKTGACLKKDGNYEFDEAGNEKFWDEKHKLDKKQVNLIPLICPDNTRVNKLPESTKIILNDLVFKTELMDI